MHLIGEKEGERKEMNGVKDTERGRYREETEIEKRRKTDRWRWRGIQGGRREGTVGV